MRRPEEGEEGEKKKSREIFDGTDYGIIKLKEDEKEVMKQKRKERRENGGKGGGKYGKG